MIVILYSSSDCNNCISYIPCKSIHNNYDENCQFSHYNDAPITHFYRVDQKKGRSQKIKIGHGGGFWKKKSMTNKKKVSIGYIETFLFYWSWIFFFKKKTTMADFHFLRTSLFLVHPVHR